MSVARIMACLLVSALLLAPICVQAQDAPKAQPAAGAKAGEPATPSHRLGDVAEVFRNGFVKFALLTVGVIGLILEFKYPGKTLPGSVAAFCFVLFFWAHSFVGEFTILAIFLFLLGLVLVGIEVFFVPGLGFAGVAGAALMFVGLLLGTLENWPADTNDWADVGATFGTMALAFVLAVGGAILVTMYLPHIPFLNHMVLKPAPAEVETASATSLSNSGPIEFLGAMGVAVTPLRPSGKAQFGGQFLDVIAEGDFIAPGGRVQVVEIEGMRIVVKAI
jgi:membrane-bound serine protease (ClpP class)